jgi:hypothetical protein
MGLQNHIICQSIFNASSKYVYMCSNFMHCVRQCPLERNVLVSLYTNVQKKTDDYVLGLFEATASVHVYSIS